MEVEMDRDSYGDGNIYMGQRSKDSSVTTMSYEDYCNRLIDMTYYINEEGSLCQRIMDNETANSEKGKMMEWSSAETPPEIWNY